MIFVTVGTELPFDRMVQVVDRWAREQGRTDVFAQIGRTRWRPSHIAFSEFLQPAEFNRRFAEADIIVSHAGMGTILSALRFEKPLLVVPRRAAFNEHRNDHQLSTVKRLRDIAKFSVAMDDSDLCAQLGALETVTARAQTGAFAAPELTAAIADFIHHGHLRDNRARPLGTSLLGGAPLTSSAPPSQVAG